MDGFNNNPMDHGSNGTKPTQSAPHVTMSQTAAGSSRQLMTPRTTQQSMTTDTLHRTISATPSAVDWEEDHDSSFSETADKLLSPRANRIEEQRSIYNNIREEIEKATKDVHSRIPFTPMTHEENMTVQQYLLHCELALAQAKLHLDIAISYATLEYGRSNTADIPRLAITKGWLEESIRRINTETPIPQIDYGSPFSELSHYFLATIITQHQHSIFGRRSLPTVHEIADILQRTEPRSYVPGVGPFLELATGLATEDPLLMPEILRRLEAKMMTDTSLKDRDNPDTNRSLMGERPQLEHQSAEPGNDQSPIYLTTDDGSPFEIDPHLDGPSSVYKSSVAPSPASVSSHETEVDPILDAPPAVNASMVEMEIDPVLRAPSVKSPAVHQGYPYGDRVEEDVESPRDSNPTESEHGLVNHSPLSGELKLEDEGETGRSDGFVERLACTDGQIDKRELRSPGLAETPAQVKLDVDMDHQDGNDHGAEPRPFYMIREEATNLVENDQRDLSVVSDFSFFDEVMQDVAVEDDPDEQPIKSTMSTITQTASRPDSHANESAVSISTPSRFHIHDSFLISDDEELEPDSNPYLAAYRARKLASASASTSNTPASGAPVVCLSDVTRRAVPRKSEPVVLISSPARPSSTQPPPASVSQRPLHRIPDSMFVSDDSDDDRPPSSNPHLAALIRAKALASASASTSGTSTPTSSTSTSRSARPKLPPHLARVRRAAHRQSLDPASQVPTPEEKQLLDQEEYPLIDIIDEKNVDGEKKYLIKWKPIHGRKFMDTWEPAENANAASVEDWELQKSRRGKRMEQRKVKKKARRGTGRERRKRPVREAAAIATQESLTRHPTPLSSPEDNPMFLVDTVGDASLASRGTRFVHDFHTPSSSPANLSSDQVSSHTPSTLDDRDDSLNSSTESAPNLTPSSASKPPSRYAAEPFLIDAVPAAPQPVPKSLSKPNNSDKYKTPAQQKARMREKRAIRRAEKAERLANMTEKQRAEHDHSSEMHKKAKRERRRTKAERLAAMPEEQRQELEEWLQWKKELRARTKEIKKERKAKKAKRRAKEARRMARKQAEKAAEAS